MQYVVLFFLLCALFFIDSTLRSRVDKKRVLILTSSLKAISLSIMIIILFILGDYNQTLFNAAITIIVGFLIIR